MPIVKAGKLRGHRYEIVEQRAHRSATTRGYVRSTRYVVKLFDDQGPYATQSAKTLPGALTKLEWMTHGQWKHELRSNPLSMGVTERNVCIGVGIIGAAALVYELTKK